MERGAPFSRILLPKSNSGVNLEQQSNPNPMTNSGATSLAGERNKGPEVQKQGQDHYMPMANVNRIMRTILPPHAKVSDEAKETIQECVTEFISFVTSEANERCQLEQRKTINADDILGALARLGFENYVGPLTTFITRYREIENGSAPRSEPPSLRQNYGANGPLTTFDGPQLGLPLPCPYGYGVCDQYMGIGPIGGDDWYYQNLLGQDGSGASGGGNLSSSMNEVPEYDPYGQFK